MSTKKRYLFIFTFLSGCSSMNNSYNYFYESLINDTHHIEITEELRNSKYSMQYFHIESQNRLGYLANADDQIFLWDVDQDIQLQTSGNKIVASTGLENNFKISSCNISYIKIMKSIANKPLTNKCLIRFTNPNSSFQYIVSNFNVIDSGSRLKIINEESYSYRLIQEDFYVDKIGYHILVL